MERGLIVRDYVRTAAAMPDLLAQIRAAITRSAAQEAQGFDWAQVPSVVLQAPEAAMQTFLDGLDERGGADDVLRAAGLSAADLDTLRLRLVT